MLMKRGARALKEYATLNEHERRRLSVQREVWVALRGAFLRHPS